MFMLFASPIRSVGDANAGGILNDENGYCRKLRCFLESHILFWRESLELSLFPFPFLRSSPFKSALRRPLGHVSSRRLNAQPDIEFRSAQDG